MTLENKYNFIVNNYKSLDGAMLIIDNNNLFEMLRRYKSQPRFGVMFYNRDGEARFSPHFTSELILIVNLMYKILKDKENDIKR